MLRTPQAPRAAGSRQAAGRHRAPGGSRRAPRSRAATAKLLAAVALVVGAAAVAGLGTYGSFTSRTAASGSVASGTVTLTMGEGVRGPAVAVPPMVPGDTAERTITLQRGATDQPFGAVTLTPSAEVANGLTHATDGLQLAVDYCPTEWKPSSTPSSPTTPLTCAGATAVITKRPLGATATTVPLGAAGLSALNGTGRTAHLRVSLTLPATTSTETQGLANTVRFTFLATQRGAQPG